jgi:hypothetical protein
MKRIAICLSGQLRTWRKVIDTWKYIVNDNDVQVDYFLHVWSENTIPKIGVPHTELELLDINHYEFDDIIKILKPVKYTIESQEQFLKTIVDKEYINPYECQYYSMFKSCELKTKHEIENNFTYDVVAKVRFDLHFKYGIINPDIIENTMYGYHCTYDENNVQNRVGDIFFYSDSKTFNTLCDFYNNTDMIPNELKDWSVPPEFSWFHYVTKNNININVNHWDIKVMRNNIDEVKNKNFDYEIL